MQGKERMALDPIRCEVDEDCACRKCGYNLRGQTATWDRWKREWRATCPDCTNVQSVRLWSSGRRARGIEAAANRVITALFSVGFGVIAAVLFAAGPSAPTLISAVICGLVAIVLAMFAFPTTERDDGRYPDPAEEQP